MPYTYLVISVSYPLYPRSCILVCTSRWILILFSLDPLLVPRSAPLRLPTFRPTAVALTLTCIYRFRSYFPISIISILDHACRQILILSSSDSLLGMLMFRLLLCNNLINFGSPASTAFRSALCFMSRLTAVALTVGKDPLREPI